MLGVLGGIAPQTPNHAYAVNPKTQTPTAKPETSDAQQSQGSQCLFESSAKLPAMQVRHRATWMQAEGAGFSSWDLDSGPKKL